MNENTTVQEATAGITKEFVKSTKYDLSVLLDMVDDVDNMTFIEAGSIHRKAETILNDYNQAMEMIRECEENYGDDSDEESSVDAFGNAVEKTNMMVEIFGDDADDMEEFKERYPENSKILKQVIEQLKPKAEEAKRIHSATFINDEMIATIKKRMKQPGANISSLQQALDALTNRHNIDYITGKFEVMAPNKTTRKKMLRAIDKFDGNVKKLTALNTLTSENQIAIVYGMAKEIIGDELADMFMVCLDKIAQTERHKNARWISSIILNFTDIYHGIFDIHYSGLTTQDSDGNIDEKYTNPTLFPFRLFVAIYNPLKTLVHGKNVSDDVPSADIRHKTNEIADAGRARLQLIIEKENEEAENKTEPDTSEIDEETIEKMTSDELPPEVESEDESV